MGERRLGVPLSVAHTIVGRVIASLRGYFARVTVVAAFNAIVIGLGALVLGVPVAGSIAVINFLAGLHPVHRRLDYGATLGIHPLAVLTVTTRRAVCSERSGSSSRPR